MVRKVNGNRDDNGRNEGIGVFTIIVIVVLAVLGISYILLHRPVPPTVETAKVPVEAPAPLPANPAPTNTP